MRATLLSGALPFASSSRARVSTPVRVLARSVVTIPHPDLAKAGDRQFIIKTFDRMPSTAHALAVVKAVEARLGPVMSFEVPRDVDTQQPRNIAFVELLRPVEGFDKPLVLEIPAPHVSKEIGTGGVGYDDVAAALRRTSNPSDNVDERDGDELARTTSKTIQFRIELPRNPTRRASRPTVWASAAERKEDDQIVRALQTFGGGFYGGFDGVADQFAHLVKETPPAETTEPAELQAEAEAEAEEAHLRQTAQRTPRPAATEPTPAPEAPAPAPAAPEPRRRSRAERLREAALEAARVNARLEAEARESATDETPQQQHEQPAEEAQSAPADTAGEEKKGMWGWFSGKK